MILLFLEFEATYRGRMPLVFETVLIIFVSFADPRLALILRSILRLPTAKDMSDFRSRYVLLSYILTDTDRFLVCTKPWQSQTMPTKQGNRGNVRIHA